MENKGIRTIWYFWAAANTKERSGMKRLSKKIYIMNFIFNQMFLVIT